MEIFELLELNQDATENEIRLKLNEKHLFFKQLIASAPNENMKRIYSNNVEKLNEFCQNKFACEILNLTEPAPISDEEYREESFAWLIRHTENLDSQQLEIKAGLNHLGRKKQGLQNEIIITDDLFVSRTHAIIEVADFEVFIYDAGILGFSFSKNGVFINGNPQRIEKKMKIKNNDTIQIGQSKFVLKINNKERLEALTFEVESSDFVKTVVIDIF